MSHILEIRKRTGQVVPFDPTKINRAVEKAFYAVTNDPHQREADLVARTVVDRLAGRADAMGESYVPSVEEVQDIVEQSIMQQGFFDVAKSYIVYRYEHQKTRVEEQKVVQEKIQNREFVITAEDGSAELFPPERIHSFFTRAARGYEGVVAVHALVEQAQKELFEGMTARDVVHTLVLVARSFVEQDPAYSIIASRLLLEGIVYVDAFGSVPADMHALHARYREAFKEMVQYGVEHKMLDGRMLTFDLEKMSAAIQPERDDLLRYLGTQTLFDRYFLRDKATATHRFIETPQYMWMRIAMGLALGEDNKEERAISFYNLMSELRYLPSTPTLFNSGTTYSQLSSCFLGVVGDDLHSIFKTYEDYAHMARHSGGVAYSWTKLRATGADVKSAGGAASNGPIPFLKVLDSTVVAINRSGRRRGACCVYLEPWHYDVEEFIELRKNTGDERRRTHDLNTALWMPDLFMKRIRENADWTLFSPDETPDLPETYGAEFERRYVAYERAADEGTIKLFKRMKARELWKKILTQLFETGHPWITFKDASNVRSPQDHVGVIHNSNLCTEITLNNEPDKEVAVCNLGSINLGEHIIDGVLSEDRIKETVLAAVRMLDNVIDLNFYPIVETRNANLRHRPIGLGLMGFQDALYKLGYNFDSEEAVQFADRSMEVISYYAILASSNLAKERGAYQTYKGSKWDRNIFPVDTLDLLEKDRGEAILVDRTESMDWSVVRENVQKYGMRNSNVMAMAPTATISNIAGCFPTIEPVYKNIYVKANISGTFIVMNDYLIEDLKKEGLWNHELLEVIKGHEGDLTHISLIPQWIKDRYKEVFLIDQQWLIKAAAARGKWIDQSQSLNIFYSGTSGAELANIYMYAWQAGLKTTYYLRSLGASAIEQSTVSLDKQQNLDKREAETLAAVAVAEIKEELVAQEPKPKFEMASVLIHKTAELKLCKIDDPNCESCQ